MTRKTFTIVWAGLVFGAMVSARPAFATCFGSADGVLNTDVDGSDCNDVGDPDTCCTGPGEGVACPVEECDDNAAAGGCCTDDTSGANGCLFESASVECRAGDGLCDAAENCDGAGNCDADVNEPDGTACGDQTATPCNGANICLSGACDENLFSTEVVCRAGDGLCDAPENCDGAGSCDPDVNEADGTPCGDQTDTTCDAANTCLSGTCEDNFALASVECRPDDSVCDVAENCDGAGNCPADAAQADGTPCGDPGDTVCDNPDSCLANECAPNNEANGTFCDDAAFCNGADSCLAGACDGHEGDPCPGPNGDGNCAESCDEGADDCIANDPDGSACDNGVNCTVDETCSVGTCGGGVPDDCDDGNLCTTDSCDIVDGCVNDETPVDVGFCFSGLQTEFKVRDLGDPAKNLLRWRVKRVSVSVDEADLGTPQSATSYALCVYDQTAEVPSLVASYTVPPSATLWSVKKPNLPRYTDKAGTADGVVSIKTKADPNAFKSYMDFRTRGANFVLPPTYSLTEYFNMDLRLTVQLINNAGSCWNSFFTQVDAKKNNPLEFAAQVK